MKYLFILFQLSLTHYLLHHYNEKLEVSELILKTVYFASNLIKTS